MNSLFSNIFLVIFSNKQRVNHQYYSQTSAGSHPTSWPCWSLRMCSLTFILQLYKSCTMTVGATHPKWPTFLRRTQQLNLSDDVCSPVLNFNTRCDDLPSSNTYEVDSLSALLSSPSVHSEWRRPFRCPHCEHTYPSKDYRFCPHCWHPLQGRPRLWGFQFHTISILSPAVIVNSSR